MKEQSRTRLDQLLDLLAEEVADRLRAGSRLPDVPADDGLLTTQAPEPAQVEVAPFEGSDPGTQAEPGLTVDSIPEPGPAGLGAAPGAELPAQPPFPPHTARLLGRMALGLLALVVVINIPINRHGKTLATAMPDRRALVIRDGLVVKEGEEPEIYVYEDGRFRWISSLTAFERRGYAWSDVHLVDNGFLDDYEMGPPVHVILKCNSSPHIYRLEGEEKRWIVDIETFVAEGYMWEDVEFVVCNYLRNFPDGETIPPGHGPPPQP
jgi:hypothetical protein